MDGSEFASGVSLPHRSRILIVPVPGNARSEPEIKDGSKSDHESAPDSDPEFAQHECLAPARIVQPGATAHVDCNKDAHQDADSNITQGKSASCTADKSLCTELEELRRSTPNTLRAVITFERQSVQMFFSPENAIADFQRKVKDLWNIPEKQYYLLLNGTHESNPPKI
jgi:hypothetical protein